MKKPLTPQQKKSLSYKKDRRNTYGERGAQSRYAIAAHKARDLRAHRHQSNQILRGFTADQTGAPDEIEAEIKAVRRRNWKKSPDDPLRKAVERKLKRRQEMGINASVKRLLKERSQFVLAPQRAVRPKPPK